MKKKIRIIFLLLFVLLHNEAFSQQALLLRSSQTPMEEFDAYVESEQVRTFAEEELKKVQSLELDIQKLNNLLEQAQESFLRGHLKNAEEFFTSVVDIAYTKDWSLEQREVIFYSFLRLAQIIGTEEEKKSYIYSAILFASDLKPDESLFPPPFIQEYYTLLKNSPKIYLPLRHIFPFHEIILINGKKFSNKDKIHLPFGEYRVTALSSSHQAWNQKISLRKLGKMKIVGVRFVRGSCASIVETKFLTNKDVLFPDFCVWSYKKVQYKKEKIFKDSLLNDLAINLPPPKPSSFWEENTHWVILGGALVIAATIVLVAHLSKGNNSPSTTPQKENQKKKEDTSENKKTKPTITIGF